MEIIKEAEDLEKKAEDLISERYNFIEECLYGLSIQKLKRYNILNKVFATRKSGHLTKSFIEFIRKKEILENHITLQINKIGKKNKINSKHKKISFFLKNLEIWDSSLKYFVEFPVSHFPLEKIKDFLFCVSRRKKIKDLTYDEWLIAKHIFFLIKRYLPLFLKKDYLKKFDAEIKKRCEI